MDRFNHEIGISGGGDDTDDTDDLPLFGSFGSYSPQYRKHNSSLVQINFPQQYANVPAFASGLCDHSGSCEHNTSGGSCCASPTPSLFSQSSNNSNNGNIGRIINTPQLRQLDVSFRLYFFHFALSFEYEQI